MGLAEERDEAELFHQRLQELSSQSQGAHNPPGCGMGVWEGQGAAPLHITMVACEGDGWRQEGSTQTDGAGVKLPKARPTEVLIMTWGCACDEF